MADEAKTTKRKQTKKADGKAAAKPNGKAGRGRPELVEPQDLPEGADFRMYTEGGHTHERLGLSADDVLGMYRNMLLQRRFEERAAQMYGRQKIAGFLHLYIGQEAISTGTVYALDDADPIITAYRDHGFGLARGMSADVCMAELYGKIDGCSRGKGGSMHYFDIERA
ncbi:MAG: thiamine pyrophosphate-dependent enzyme, partial [Rhodothermales bacterium]|nr:thiamine pyrophosphate-dependent enzyme [Rhodothermales bacterium]